MSYRPRLISRRHLNYLIGMSHFKLSLFSSLAMLLGMIGCMGSDQSSVRASARTITAFKPEPDAVMQQRLEWMIGYWYGDQPTKNGGRKQYLAHHEADGKLAVIFKISDSLKGERNYSETGLWGLSGAYFSTLINHSDEPFSFNAAAPSPSSWNIYQIENIQKDELRYISVETGNRYEMRRVTQEFKMP